jgi:hypothetical protein
MRRALAPAAFWLVEPLMIPVLVAALLLMAHPTRLAMAAFAAAMVVQGIGATATISLLRRRFVPWAAPLEVLRSATAFACWLGAVASKRVEWRGHPYEIVDRDSRIVPAPARRASSRLRAARRVWAVLRA